MPIPKPNKGEEKSHFISRCIAFETEQNTGRKPTEIQAICYTAWDRRNIREGVQMDAKIVIIGNLAESTIDKDKKVINHVALLSSVSKNNRDYTDNCLSKSVSLLEGVKSYTNHKADDGVRDIRDLIGIYRNVLKEGNKVFGDLHLLNDGGEVSNKVLAIAEQMPEAAGNSISARGRYHRKDGRDIIEELTQINSVDLVTDPATTSSLFESIDNINKEENGMEIKDLTIKEIKAQRHDLYDELINEGKTSRDKEVNDLTEENKNLKKELDDFKVKEKIEQKKLKVQEILKDSKIAKELVTDTFLETLYEVEDADEKIYKEKIEKIIKDRKGIAKDVGVKNYGEEAEENLNEEETPKISDEDFDEAVLGEQEREE